MDHLPRHFPRLISPIPISTAPISTVLLIQVDPHFSVSRSLPARTFGRRCQDRRALSAAGAQWNKILDARRVFVRVAGSDLNKAKFSDHETRSDHSFPIWRSRANQGWLVFKSPKEVSCLVFACLHHSPISPIQVACQLPPSLSKSCMSRTVAHPLFPQLSRVFRSMMSRIPALRALHRSCLVPGPWFLVFIGVVYPLSTQSPPLFPSYIYSLY